MVLTAPASTRVAHPELKPSAVGLQSPRREGSVAAAAALPVAVEQRLARLADKVEARAAAAETARAAAVDTVVIDMADALNATTKERNEAARAASIALRRSATLAEANTRLAREHREASSQLAMLRRSVHAAGIDLELTQRALDATVLTHERRLKVERTRWEREQAIQETRTAPESNESADCVFAFAWRSFF